MTSPTDDSSPDPTPQSDPSPEVPSPPTDESATDLLAAIAWQTPTLPAPAPSDAGPADNRDDGHVLFDDDGELSGPDGHTDRQSDTVAMEDPARQPAGLSALSEIDPAATHAAGPALVPHEPPRAGSPICAACGRPYSAVSQRPDERPRRHLVLLAAYASAMTIFCLWLLYQDRSPAPHVLESLPDVAPLKENEFRYAPASASMPPGHVLPLGSSQRLGHIRVEPLRITRGPVRYVHFSGDLRLKRPPTDAVLKLWLRFTNVSRDQVIAPLDAVLLFSRSLNGSDDSLLCNHIVRPAASAVGPDDDTQSVVPVLDHPLTSEWDLEGQSLGRALAPGESVETFVPLSVAETGLTAGAQRWRLHIRKGFHAASGHGVTTMFEVPFEITDVQPES